MTHPAPAAQPVAYRITPQDGDELDELLGAYEAALARAKEAKDFADGISTRIKSLLTASVPQGTRKIDVAGNAYRKPRCLSWVAKQRFARDRFDADYPQVYEKYLEWGKGYWSW